MQSNLKVYAFIFARKNSQRIKNKNLINLMNKSLLERSIDFAKNLKVIDKIFVSTDSEIILKKAKELNCETIIRPKYLTHSRSLKLIHGNMLLMKFEKNLKKNSFFYHYQLLRH